MKLTYFFVFYKLNIRVYLLDSYYICVFSLDTRLHEIPNSNNLKGFFTKLTFISMF